jgi:hypothetical protein
MSRIYLASGQEAELLSKTDNGQFVVSPIYETYSGDECYEHQGAPIIVNEVFETEPIEKFSEECKRLINMSLELRQEAQGLTSERQTLRNDIHRLKNESNDLNRWIVDLSKFKTCKRFAFFITDAVMPVVVDTEKIYKSSDRWKLSFYVGISNGKIQEWLSGYHFEDQHTSDHKVDQKYGYMFDISDEDLVKIANERSETIDLERLSWHQKADKIKEPYITPRIRQWLEENRLRVKQSTIENLKRDIEQKQNQLTELEG